MNEPVSTMVFGRIRATRVAGGDIVIVRDGRIGHGRALTYRLWSHAQALDVLAEMNQRRGPDASCERRAVRWAIELLR